MDMSVTHEPALDDQQYLRYLLRLLPDEQTERVEEASIVDNEVALRLRAVECDLVDGYVRGTLDRDTMQRFESYYLSSPLRRERVRFAGDFLRAIDGAAAPVGVEREQPVLRRRHLMTIAAAAVLAFGMLLLGEFRLGIGRSGIRTDTRTAATAPAAGPSHDGAPVAAPAAPVPPLTADRSAKDAPGGTIALVLLAQTRAIGSIPALTVPARAARVTFELRLESRDYSRYQAGLRDPRTNETIWRSGWIAATSAAGRPSIDVSVPAALLKAQHYSLDLTGRGTTGATHVVGSYAFRVTPP
jgi:hypothetical protein